jgi:hypothetical protein
MAPKRQKRLKVDLRALLAEPAETEPEPAPLANVISRSEFPSLGGNAQPQQQNASFPQNVSPWANAGRARSPERRAYAVGIGRARVSI